jgi:Na+-driven multidrug efflux pump
MQEQSNKVAKRVAKNTAFLYARMGITVFISLYSTRLILAALGASDFGIFNVVGGAIVMLTFLNNAMAAATQRFMSYAQGEGNHQKQKNIFNVSIVLHLFIGVFLVFLLEGAGYVFFNGILRIDPDRMDAAKLIYHFLVISTFIKVISVPYDAVINAHENMFFVAILGIFEAISKLCIALYITNTNFDKLTSYGLLMASLTVVLLVIQRTFCSFKYEETKLRPIKYFSKPLFVEMSSFGGWSLLGSAASLFSIYGQGIVINLFFGTVVNAAQGVANQINGQIGAFSTTMLKALNPVIVKSEGAGDRKKQLKAALIGSKFTFALMAFFAIPAIIEMPYILSIWLVEVPEYTILFCRLLLVKSLIEQQFFPLSTSISAAGDIKHFQITLSILALLPLFISYLLFNIGYPPATIYILFIIQVSIRSFGVILYYARKLCGLSISHFLKDVIIRNIIVVIFSIILSIIPIVIMQQGMMRLLLILTIHSIVFVLCFYLIGFNTYEKHLINDGIKPLTDRIRFKNK